MRSDRAGQGRGRNRERERERARAREREHLQKGLAREGAWGVFRARLHTHVSTGRRELPRGGVSSAKTGAACPARRHITPGPQYARACVHACMRTCMSVLAHARACACTPSARNACTWTCRQRKLCEGIAPHHRPLQRTHGAAQRRHAGVSRGLHHVDTRVPRSDRSLLARPSRAHFSLQAHAHAHSQCTTERTSTANRRQAAGGGKALGR